MGLWSWLRGLLVRPVPAGAARRAGAAGPRTRAPPPIPGGARCRPSSGHSATARSPSRGSVTSPGASRPGRAPGCSPGWSTDADRRRPRGRSRGSSTRWAGRPVRRACRLPRCRVPSCRCSAVPRVARRPVTSCSARCGSTGRAGRCSARCRTFAGRRRWCSGRWSRRRDRAVPRRRPGCRGFPGRRRWGCRRPSRRRPRTSAAAQQPGPGPDHMAPDRPDPNHPSPNRPGPNRPGPNRPGPNHSPRDRSPDPPIPDHLLSDRPILRCLRSPARPGAPRSPPSAPSPMPATR